MIDPKLFVVPDLMNHRAMVLGDRGSQWIADLPEMIGDIERHWSLKVLEQLSGATEALVFLVVFGDETAVLKVGTPGSSRSEARALQLADGRGYVKLLAYDKKRDAMLLERLGDKLADSLLSNRKQIEIICETLCATWVDIDDPTGLTTGAEKARLQASFIQVNWELLKPPCVSAVKDLALDFAAYRELAYDPVTSVLVHGDAHIWNTLQETDGAMGYKFVDPDGLYAEPAFDLGILLREWREELLAGDTLKAGKDRCALLAKLTGVDSEAIWQWGFIEHVSCGLLDIQLCDKQAAEAHFAIATSWLNS